MTEKRKSKKFMLIVLLALFVVVASALIGTLAKYMTSSTISDDAVAAKFGLNIPNTVDLFSDSYTNVLADTSGKKIVAPGTSGQYKFELTGTSEVSYKVSANITVAYSEEWNEYEPLEFSVNGTTWTNLEQFKTNLSSALESKTLLPNETYSNAQTIHWRWPFHTSTENDAKDTQMGITAAEGTAPEVTVSIEVIAAQAE